MGDERLIAIIKCLKGVKYLSGKGGSKYQDKKKFIKAGIIIEYTDFYQKEYKQLSDNFEEGLSILDALFNLGIKNTFDLLKNN